MPIARAPQHRLLKEATAAFASEEGFMANDKPPSQNPRITTLYGGPVDTGCGGVQWLVEFELPNAPQADGWIIQQVTRSYDIRKPDGSIAIANLQGAKQTFWEAWPVKKGETKTANRYDATDEGFTYDDAFDQPRRPGTRGVMKVVGLVKFFEGALPATFIKQNPETRAQDLPSTTKRPDFWDETGTIHNLTVTWDCTTLERSAKPAKIVPLVQDKKK